MKNRGFIDANVGVLIAVALLAGLYFVNQFVEKAPIISVKEEPTLEWKTYTNAEYGFEIQYPSSWYSSDQVGVFATRNHPFTLGDDAPTFVISTSSLDSKWNQLAYTNEQGQQVNVRVEESCEESRIHIYVSYTCEFFNEFYGNYTKQRHINLGDVILTIHDPLGSSTTEFMFSTFKFTESSWKTYRNDVHGFEFKYPTDLFTVSPQNTFVGLSSKFGDMQVRVIDSVFKPSEIQGPYGIVKETTIVSAGSTRWYRFRFGDGGCGGPMYQTGIASKTLEVYFKSCLEDTAEPDAEPYLYNNGFLIEKILSTFRFTK